VWGPVGSLSLHPLSSTMAASNFQEMLMSSKLSPSGYTLLAMTSFVLGYKPWYHSRTNVSMSVVTMRRSDVHHLLPMCHVHIKVRIKFSASVFITFKFQAFLYTMFKLEVHKPVIQHWYKQLKQFNYGSTSDILDLTSLLTLKLLLRSPASSMHL
jgi:hypothetical protein